ncbi:B3/4 domain-containing protein [Kitasatospora sp. NPDC096147]|uniref:B3/B4 domain-containing protein n=1 Tax=Kitasatospora sp. NPDC096147 TaxID=3364093 RepID=UPI0037F4F41D
MTTFRLDPSVATAFPQARIVLVTAHGVRGREEWPATAGALAELEQLAAGSWRPADETDERIAAWHAAYRAFGTNPRRVRPSVDALGRRLARQGRLPRINPAVDSYNAVSVRHGLPAGAFDLAALEGEVTIRHAAGGERFTPLGEPETVEHPVPGEVVYADGEHVLTRHWNHRDAHRTRVTADSRAVVFVLETLRAEHDGALLTAATDDLLALLAPHADATAVHALSPAGPVVELG